MNWLTPTWLSIASACLTLAVIHAHVWMRRGRAAGANAAFAVLAVSVALYAIAELGVLQAETTAEFGRALWWGHLPAWSAIVAIVCFVRLYMRAGRPWLAWTVVCLRTLALAMNFASWPAPLHYRQITSLEKVTVFGDTLSFARGVPNPWVAVGQLALVALVLFVADAVLDIWRRGERRRAMTIGGSLVLFVGVATMLSITSSWGLARVLLSAMLVLLPIVV